MEYKNQFIELLRKNYDKFTWTRDNFEFSTEIGNYNVILNSDNTGVYIAVNTTNKEGEYQQHCVYADKNESVREIYDDVFECWNKQRESNFWHEATLAISKEIIKSPSFKIE